MRGSNFVRSCGLMTEPQIQLISPLVNAFYQDKNSLLKLLDLVILKSTLRKQYIIRVRYKEIL